MNKIRKGDEVIVIAGKDKGRRGKCFACFADARVLVEGINMVKKHQKPNPQAGVPAASSSKEMPLSSPT
jgi:large subunit ribosomal protein L24